MDFEEIISRFKSALSIKTDKELAEILGISASDFSLRKRRGTIKYLLFDFAVDRGIDMNWVFRGESVQGDSSSDDNFESFKVTTNNRFTVLESKIDRVLEIYDNFIEIDLDRKVSGEE